MVPGQVGEPADSEGHRVDPTQRERVAGHLHHHGVHAALHHHRQQRLQIGRLRGGQRGGLVASVDADADGADETGHPVGRPQPGFDQVAGGGLARRAGDADHAQLRRRLAVHRGGDTAEHRARRRVHQHRGAQIAEFGGAGLVGQHGDGPGGHGLGGEHRPVGTGPGQCREEVPRAGVLTAQRHPGHGDVPAGCGGRARGHQLGDRVEGQTDGVSGAQIHGVDTVPGGVAGPRCSGRQFRAVAPALSRPAESMVRPDRPTAAHSRAAATRRRCCGTAAPPRYPGCRRRPGAARRA